VLTIVETWTQPLFLSGDHAVRKGQENGNGQVGFKEASILWQWQCSWLQELTYIHTGDSMLPPCCHVSQEHCSGSSFCPSCHPTKQARNKTIITVDSDWKAFLQMHIIHSCKFLQEWKHHSSQSAYTSDPARMSTMKKSEPGHHQNRTARLSNTTSSTRNKATNYHLPLLYTL